MRALGRLLVLFAALVLAGCVDKPASKAAPAATPGAYEPTSGQAGKDVIWVPTSQALVDRMLAMAQVTEKDFVMDLGSGDGRLVITAAQRGARALGIEYNPDMVELSKKNAERAGVGPGDFDHLMLYDAFTSGPPIMLESLGVCRPGEGVHFFAVGRSTPGGKLPINTSGGGLSYTHSGMYGIFPIIESVRQLRGECGPRQVPSVRLSLVNGMGGMLSAAGTLVLSNET
jgi:hypothetical protein